MAGDLTTQPHEDHRATEDSMEGTVTADPALLEAGGAATAGVPAASGGDSGAGVKSVSGVAAPEDADPERVARYAAPVESLLRFTLVGWNAAGYAKGIARREMVVADAEQAGLVARVAELEAEVVREQNRVARAQELREAAEQRERTLREAVEHLRARAHASKERGAAYDAWRVTDLLDEALASHVCADPDAECPACAALAEPVPAPPVTQTSEEGDCPHAAPFRYCNGCAVSPCPIGLDGGTP